MTAPGGEGPDARTYFTGLAQGYAKHRPTYPAAIVDAILDGVAPPARVADVGCGTGIMTRLLAARGARVVGIDPNADMLAEARRAPAPPDGPAPEYRLGTGEQTGLPAASRDVVVVAQAFHWFDAASALRELARVLLRGGRLALVWNTREAGSAGDPALAFTAEYDAMTRVAEEAARAAGRRVESGRSADPTTGGHFTLAGKVVAQNPHALDLEGLLGRARSTSYFPREGPLKAELEARLEAAFARHARDGRVVLVQRTELTLATRA